MQLDEEEQYCQEEEECSDDDSCSNNGDCRDDDNVDYHYRDDGAHDQDDDTARANEIVIGGPTR